MCCGTKACVNEQFPDLENYEWHFYDYLQEE